MATAPGASVPPLTSAKDGLTVKEAAEKIGVSFGTLHNWIKNGDLPVTRFGPAGRIVRVHPDDLDNMIQAG